MIAPYGFTKVERREVLNPPRRSSWRAEAAGWNALLQRSVSDVPFLRFEFLRAWWSTLGGGEWSDGSLWIVAGRDEQGQLAAAAPLFRTGTGSNTFLLLGTHEIADYLDVLAAPSDLDALAGAVLERIEAEGRHATLDLWNLREASPTREAFSSAAAQAGWSVARQRLKPCPFVSLEGGWEAYLGRLDKKQRHELRRKMRRAAEYPDGLKITRVSNGPGLEKAVEAFLGLMRLDRAKDGFLTPPMLEMFRSLTSAAAESGWLRLELLSLGGRPAAGAYCFDYADRLWVFNSGIDPEYQSLSPAQALLGHLIQTAKRQARSRFPAR
jgi:CelD/BcsL family acetyltransferase involved in cellulose biosynthesis